MNNLWQKNALWIGLVMGLVIPFVGYALLLTIYEQLENMGWISNSGLSSNFRERTLAIIAICLNAIPLNFFQRYHSLDSMRGLVIPTALYAIGWLLYFGKGLVD